MLGSRGPMLRFGVGPRRVWAALLDDRDLSSLGNEGLNWVCGSKRRQGLGVYGSSVKLTN